MKGATYNVQYALSKLESEGSPPNATWCRNISPPVIARVTVLRVVFPPKWILGSSKAPFSIPRVIFDKIEENVPSFQTLSL